jgi:hypothetical protein
MYILFYLIILSLYFQAKIGTKAKVEIPKVLFLLLELILISLPALSSLFFDLIYYFRQMNNTK